MFENHVSPLLSNTDGSTITNQFFYVYSFRKQVIIKNYILDKLISDQVSICLNTNKILVFLYFFNRILIYNLF